MKQFKMNERQRFSIRKFSIGAASVLLGSVFFVANPATEVQAAEASTAVVAQDGDVKPDNPSALSPSEASSQNPNVGQAGTEAKTQGTEKKEPGTPSKDSEGKTKSTVENTGDEKVDGVVKPVSGESSPVFEEEKDKKEAQSESEEETASIGRRSKSPQSQDRSVENQKEESVASSTSYINGEGSYSLSDDIHKLLQRLKNSDENQEQVKNLNAAYEKFNAALGTSETGLVDQEIFNAALEEYRKASQLQQGEAANLDGNLRHSRETSSLRVGLATGKSSDPQYSTKKVVPVLTGEAVGNNIRLIAESLSGRTITNIDVQGLDGLGLTKSSLKTIGSRGYVDLTGRIPSNKHGLSNIVVTATDSAGHSEHTTVSIARPLPTPRFTTTSQDLEGKSNEKPVVSGNIGTTAESNNLPSDAELKAYLVTGGRQNPYSFLPEADGYHVVAEALVKADGSFDFVPTKYSDQTKGIGTDNLRLVVAYVQKGTNTTYYEGLKTDFSANSIKATAPVDKSKLIEARNALDELTKEADPTTGKTTSTATAYKTAKQEAEDAVRKADEVIQDKNATADKVSTALNTVSAKTEALNRAKNQLKEAASETARNTLKTSAEALEKASTDNKTPKSVEVYNQKYEALKAELERVKTEAKTIADKGADASKEEVETSQTAVNGVKQKLDEAARVLVEQADKGKLTTARNALD
ncbi:YSIRK-type signal peptide-containing protein, partial [Streptococcus sp. 1621]|uniref:YSIRK-type signal peptide-containing protein n=1 Tax=Streptococcus sp. 1621 TaxID=2582676 RepID=UPI001566A2A3